MTRLPLFLCSLILLVGVPLVAIRMLVGKRVFEQAAGHWLYDSSKSFVRALTRAACFCGALVARLVKRIGN